MDETIKTPEAEVTAPIEGTVDAQISKEGVITHEEKKQETVPLAVYLELKDDIKTLKKEMKEAGSKKETVAINGFEDIKSKYPDVSPEFIQDILSVSTESATKKIEEKYSPIIEKQEIEKKQVAFDKAFDTLFDKTLQENPDLPKNIDKEAIKELAITSKYRNTPLVEILNKMYPAQNTGKTSSENDQRSSSDRVEDIVSFDKITPDQKEKIMDDPVARSKYFSWLDNQVGR